MRENFPTAVLAIVVSLLLILGVSFRFSAAVLAITPSRIASARHSEPSTRMLATISVWTEAQPITVPKLANRSLCRALAPQIAWMAFWQLPLTG